MSDHKPSLTARWSNGRKVTFGRDALDFLAEEAAKVGEDFETVRRAIVKDSPLARMLLARLGLTREALAGPGRPRDVPRLLLIGAVVNDLLENGRSEAEAYRLAPQYLADPKRRRKDCIGSALPGTAYGKGHHKPHLTAEAVAVAYVAFRAQVGPLYFDAIGDAEAEEKEEEAFSSSAG